MILVFLARDARDFAKSALQQRHTAQGGPPNWKVMHSERITKRKKADPKQAFQQWLAANKKRIKNEKANSKMQEKVEKRVEGARGRKGQRVCKRDKQMEPTIFSRRVGCSLPIERNLLDLHSA